MKIIFLDFDGVVNSVQRSIALKERLNAYSAEGIDPVALGLLKWVCSVTDAKIVISSLWRVRGIEWIKGVFAAHGWFSPPIVDITPRLNTKRGEEIQAYILNKMLIEPYVIIDDDSDMLQHQLDNFVHTDSLVGFTIYDAMRCIEILGAVKDFDYIDDINQHVKFRKKGKVKEVKFHD